MRPPRQFLCLVPFLALAAPALAQDPAPPAAEPSSTVPLTPGDVAAEPGSQPAPGAGLPLSPELVHKLSAEQLVEVLKAREARQLLGSDGRSDDGAAVEIVVPVAFFGSIALVVWLVLFFRARRHAQVQQTLRLMVEKGRDIPPELLVPAQPPRADLRRGILLIAIGVSVSGFLLLVDGSGDGAWGLGAIPLLIGVGYLIVYRLAGNGRTPGSAT